MSTDRILSSCAIFISLLTLVVSIWQGIETRKFNRLSVKPNITITPYFEGKDGKNGIYISNSGLGPALVKETEIIANDKHYSLSNNSWPEILKEEGINPQCFALSWIPVGTVLEKNEDVSIIRITKASLGQCYLEVKKLMEKKNLKIIINYQSMYEKKYTTNQSLTLGSDAAKLFN